MTFAFTAFFARLRTVFIVAGFFFAGVARFFEAFVAFLRVFNASIDEPPTTGVCCGGRETQQVRDRISQREEPQSGGAPVSPWGSAPQWRCSSAVLSR